MRIGKYSLALNREDIKLSDFEIASHYLGINKLPSILNNPLREDKNPSLGVFSKDFKRVGFKDFATGETMSLFKFLSRLWNVPSKEVLERIYKDIASTQKLSSIRRKLKKSKVSHLTDLQVRVRKWNKKDIEYWNSYGIEFNFLKQTNTYPIDFIILKYGNSEIINRAEEYAYAYIEFKDDKTSIKVYQPFADRQNKFKNNHHTSVWDLWDNLPPKGDKIIITSSRKDAMCLWCNTGIPSTCLQSESTMPNSKVVNELKDRFKEVYVLYDNDFTKSNNPGQTFGNKISKEYNLINICIPTQYNAKDSSDLYKQVGKEKFIEIINNLISNHSKSI